MTLSPCASTLKPNQDNYQKKNLVSEVLGSPVLGQLPPQEKFVFEILESPVLQTC